MTKIYLIAGEPSGDVLGAKLITSLKRVFPDLQLYGIGGESMRSKGFESLFDISPLSVMGLFEVIPSIPEILFLEHQLIQDILEKNPDIVITIDSYSFSSRIHKKLVSKGIKIKHVHVVAPQVWAWKAHRAQQVYKFFDHLFCLLPSEPQLFEPHGMKCTYIGHPITEDNFFQRNKVDCKQKLSLDKDAQVVSVLFGSRKNEVHYLLPILKKAIEDFSKIRKNVFVLVPTVDTVQEKIKKELKGWKVPHKIITGEENRHLAFCASDMAVAASGTVSLELAIAKVPHVIVYKVNCLTGWLARKILKIKYVNLINILSGKEIIPELLQDKCTSQEVLFALQRLVFDPFQKTNEILQLLGLGDKLKPTEKIALKVKELIDKND